MNQRSIVALTGLALAVYAAWLVYLGLVLPPERADALFSETGWFEDLSAVFWLVLAAVLLFARPIRLSRRIGMAVIAAALAAREEGWHKKFTTDSLFKSDYYQMTGVPMAEKLIAGAVAVGLTITLIWLLVLGGREIVGRGGWRRPWGWLALFAVAISPILKAVDRGPSILRVQFDITLPENIDMVMLSLEEGMESALPVLFLLALGLYLMDRRSGGTTPAADRAHG
ncbi:hypothetical protein LV475_00435 [Guyparkeria hydrothermalis]|uniref:Uncharacterized protein n=1 Tax=Guyparkeria halophila TaxID=47960 RepID=A0A6I6D1A9_9GAMM|nr:MULTISPECIES: hypothetical protein [Guyparkeria]MCL7750075.1 hypothetical protein [Guyparkeria hydrothermalis]QGT78678.1 hypothetical protein GM160_07075 [Guyparkeria halophila]TKA88816.1 hypothetical protein FAZ79_08450 [Guyparkeria sp. SB14A]